MATKTLAELTNEVLFSNESVESKADALVKLGVTPYEAMILAKSSLRGLTHPQDIFTFTFGVEIECTNCVRQSFFAAARRNGIEVYNQVYYNHNDMPIYKLTTDSSIQGENPAECVTPALKNTDGFESLKKCVKSLNEIGATANSSCGLHVHIGAAELTDQEYCNVFVNYMRLEDAIESFLAPSRRGRNARWCASLRNHASEVLMARRKGEMRSALNYDRHYRVNAESYARHSTIEFRQHQGTTNYTKISNWVKFLGKLVEYSKTHRLNQNINRIEDIPFLNEEEKRYFIQRRVEFARRAA